MAQGRISCEILLIGGSAGSLDVLLQVLPALNHFLNFPVVVVLHRKYSEISTLPVLLSSKTKHVVKEPEDKEFIEKGVIYVAPADYHLLIEQGKYFSLDYSEKVNYSRPSIDVTFENAADIYGKNAVAVLLSGANSDGVNGLTVIKQAGGFIIAQDPETAQTPYMPQQAINAMHMDAIMNIEQLINFINNLA